MVFDSVEQYNELLAKSDEVEPGSDENDKPAV